MGRHRARRVGLLTGGGDCPGLNAVIRAVVRSAIRDHGMEVLGILEGFKGLLEPNTAPLAHDDVANILTLGGTILETSPELSGAQARRADLPRRRRHPPQGVQARAEGARGHRHPQDHRPRSGRHRRDHRVRLLPCGRGREHRPAPQHRRLPSPDHGNRGDGQSRRLARAVAPGGVGGAAGGAAGRPGRWRSRGPSGPSAPPPNPRAGDLVARGHWGLRVSPATART